MLRRNALDAQMKASKSLERARSQVSFEDPAVPEPDDRYVARFAAQQQQKSQEN
jgi:hypothetical protein